MSFVQQAFCGIKYLKIKARKRTKRGLKEAKKRLKRGPKEAQKRPKRDPTIFNILESFPKLVNGFFEKFRYLSKRC